MNELFITLCGRCLKIENERNDITVDRKDKKQTIKDTCNICQTNRGFEYVIKEKRAPIGTL